MKPLTGTVVAGAIALFLLQCMPGRLADGGTGEETTNGRIVGAVVDSSARPVAGAVVSLIAADCDPVRDTAVVRIDTTDEAGNFDFSRLDSGAYNVRSTYAGRALCAMVFGVDVRNDTLEVQVMKVLPPGTIRVRLPSGADAAAGYVFIPGTDIFAYLNGRTDAVALDFVPAGRIPSVAYATSTSPAPPSVIRYDVPVRQARTVDVYNPEWLHAVRIGLNTARSGADVAGMVMNFPVLVRLTEANFAFGQAGPSGEDIMFAKTDNTPLPYEIERWDAAAQTAEIWVKLDTVYGNDSTQSITMYWGKAGAAAQSNSAVVFDTAAGFQGIWHLGEADSLALDATGNRYNGTGNFTTSVPGVIGNAQHFNGRSSCIRMKGTAPQSRLNFPMSGRYMISAWIYHDTLADSVTYLIAGKGELQYFIKSYGLAQSTSQHAHQWEFSEYHGNNIWQGATQIPAMAKEWTHLVGIRDGSNQYLYVNGSLAMAGYRVFGTGQDTIRRDTTDDFTIGAFLRPVTAWGQGYAWFSGAIDEVEVSSVPRSADWIKLSYMNQKAQDALVKFK